MNYVYNGKMPSVSRVTNLCQIEKKLPYFPLWSAGVLMAVFAVVPLAASAQNKIAPTDQQTKSESTESWLSVQIRRFRSYPHLHKAYRLLQEGKINEAATSMKTYLKINPNDLDVRTGYFSVLYRQRNTDELLREVAYVLERHPDNMKALLYHGLASQTKGDIHAGLRSFKRVYLNEKASVEDRILAANTATDMALAHARHMDGLEALTVLLPLQDTYRTQYRLGLALAGNGNTEAAEHAYVAALQRARTSEERIQSQSALGYLAQQKGDMGKAARYGEAILALNPANIEWMRNLAQIYYTRKSYQRAEKMARRVFNTTQTVQDSIYLANILAERKNYAEAIQHYTRIAEKAKDDELIYRASMGLGYAYQITGKQAAAHQSFSRAAHIKPGHEARAAMALTNSETNPFAPRTQHPPNLTELLASYKKYPTAHTAAAIGYAYAQKEEHEKAAYYLSAAVKKKNNPAWRLQLTQHYVALRQPTKALEALQPLLGEKVQAETQARALRQMGYIHAQAGDFPAAAAAFQSAIERGYADASTRRELGFIYAELKKYPEAIEQLLHVMAAQPAPKDLLGIGRIYAAMNEPGPALQYYKMAESQPQGLDKRELAALYGEMGFLFAQGEQFEHAHRAWSKAADLHNTPDLQLNLAYAEEMRGMQQDAFARIDAIQHDQLDRSQKLRLFAQYARLYKKDGDYDNTVRYLTQALMLEPSAERHYELALYAIKKEKYADARVHLEDAVRLAPQNQTYRLQLAYVCKHQSDSPCTIAAFEHVAGSNPERLALQQDLAYAYAQAGDNEKSIAWFKKAIDTGEKNLLAQASGMQGSSPSGELAQAEAVDAQQVYAMRQQIREMTRSYQFNAYQGYRSNTRQLSNIVSPSFTTGGVVPSQGGVEFLYQPPGIGYQDGRTFRLFGRALWSNRPGSLHIESNTVQGGLGVEYKPLRDENIYVGVERLIKIGSQSENNWLLRASWGYSNGYDLKPNQPSWNQTIVYADVGYFIQHDNIRSVYAELRQGRTFNIDNRLLLTPHVTLAGRGQTPDPFDASYLEIGAGISLKYLFNETHYSAARSSGELTVQYRKATTGNHEGGWLATAALRF